MQRILVTGGVGFIGSPTSLLLIEKGYEILIVDSLINSSIKALERINKIIEIKFPQMKNKLSFFKGDLRDESFIREVFSNQNKIQPIIPDQNGTAVEGFRYQARAINIGISITFEKL